MLESDMFKPIVGAIQIRLEAEEAVIRTVIGSADKVDSVDMAGEVLIESIPADAPIQVQQNSK